jgi:heavy metal-binding protein
MKTSYLLLFAGLATLSPIHAITESPAQKYTCLMHPEVMKDAPGECPKCGMPLVPVKEQKPKPNRSQTTHETHRTYDHQMTMASSLNLADPMSRESSGSSWVPDSTPIYGRMLMFAEDMLMLHGAIFPRYVNTNTRRGDDRIDAPNWFMAMYTHPLGENAQLGFRGMMSLDLLTEGGRGYPLLFQSGETWNGQALHDRQHPHDLFDEISLSYSQKFGPDFSAYLYAGYPGEPALGPPAFMHRLSAMDNPDAPLSHHWQDSTHVTFGVVTLGVVWRDFKIEGSTFKGREPDEQRYDFDEPKLDSFSGRISWNPTKDLAFQISHGYLHSPEELEPDTNRHRTTASLIYNRALGHDSNWSNSIVWGQNHDTAHGKTQSILLETNYQRGRDTFYARFEHVEKPGHELVLDPIDEERVFPINAWTLGYVRDLAHGGGIDVGLGGQFTIHDIPTGLDRYYGDDVPFSFQVFLRVRPSLMASRHEMPTEK